MNSNIRVCGTLWLKCAKIKKEWCQLQMEFKSARSVPAASQEVSVGVWYKGQYYLG